MDIFFVVLREPPSGMGTQDEVPSRRVRRLHPHRIRLTANRIRPFLDRFSTITVESSKSKVQITSAKTLNNKGGLARQVRCFASRSYLHASRHQQIRSKTAGFRISARPSLPRRGETWSSMPLGAGPSACVHRHGPVGLVHGWNTRCRYGVPERSLPFTPCSLMLLKRVPRRF